ncbi:MAG: CHASE2 domain-containing protein, partial [Proteobacteria bacterium]|nr:CHASE2 domain-containing protein [Pseudomonadota bacterium]
MPPVRPTRANPAWLRLLPGALIGLAAALVSLTFWSGGLLQSWEAVTFDWRARLLAAPGPNTDNIRLILLDQKSLDWAEEHFGLSWPWPRQVYAPIIDFCRRAGAKSIAFDVVYT